MAERADLILKKLGYTKTSVDSDYGFDEKTDYYDYAETDNASNRWERIRTGQPAIIYFWHRTSPRYFEPLQSETVLPDDPSNDVAGMTKVILDTRGRLLELNVVPPQVIDKTTAQTGEVDWTILFTEAGLDIRNYRRSESNWTSPVFADANFSWEGAHVDHAEIPVRIEAAAFQGKPVYFQIVAPWDKPVRQEEISPSAPVRAAGVLLITLFLSIVVAGVFLARRNLRQGRSDTKGAFKITIFVFLVTLAASLLIADHIPNLAIEIPLLTKMAGTALFNAALIGLIYLALEPYVRRRWASLIISWNRLLAGDFSDPLVGRDILIGGLLGLAHPTMIYLMTLLPDLMGITVAPNPSAQVTSLQGFRHLLANFIGQSAGSIFMSLSALLLLVLLVTIFRKQWLAIAVFWTLDFLILGLFFASGDWIAWIGVALIAAITIICVARFGLLATISFFIFFHLTFHNPITANISSWYFGNTIFAAVLILGLSIYGFYISLAGQTVFQTELLTETKN